MSAHLAERTAEPRPAWLGLLCATLFTALWTGLICTFPVLPESGFVALTVRLAVQVVIALGLWLGLERAKLSAGQRRMTWLAVMIPFTLWAGLASTAAIDGVFRPGISPLPLLPGAIFLPLIIGAPLLLLSARVGELLDAMPAPWLVVLQFYRVFGSQWLAYWLRGVLPGLWALPAGLGDVLTGLFAIPVAIGLSTGALTARKAAIAWNIFGIAELTLAIVLGMITSPGPFQLIFPTGPNIGLADYPNVLTPAFVVPGSILLHALSLRQLYRRDRAAPPGR